MEKEKVYKSLNNFVKNKIGIKSFFASLLLGSILLFVLVFFDKLVTNQLDSHIRKSLDNIAVQQQLIIDTTIKDLKSNLFTLSKPILDNKYSNKTVETYINEQLLNSNFSNLIFIDFSKDSKELKTPCVKEALYNNELVINFKKDTSIYKPILRFVLPIKTQNLNGVLIAEYSFVSIVNELKDIMSDYGYTIIVNSKGSAYVSTAKEYFDLDRLKQGDVEFIDFKSFDEILQDHINSKGGMVVHLFKETKYTSLYKPLSINNWAIVVVKVGKDLKQIVYSTLFAIVAVFLSIIVFSIYFTYLKRNNQQKIEKLVFYDELTNSPNVAKFKIDVSKKLKTLSKKEYAIIKVNFLNLKAINEIYGYATGDEVIKAMAQTCKYICSHYKKASYCRVYADEFMLFVPNKFANKILDEKQFSHYVGYCKKLVSTLKDYKQELIFARYYLSSKDVCINDMINKVDMVFEYAKKDKVKIVYDYDDALKNKVILISKLSNNIEKAMKNNELVPFLQPKIELNNSQVYGAEALVRWVEKDGNVISPDDFIPLFESNGFIVKLDMHILEIVCKSLREWIDKGIYPVPISVNFSRLHMNNKEFVKNLVAVVDKYKVPHMLIEVELTETAIIDENQADVLLKLFDDLHQEGFSIAIDDFGTGYSSLGLLKNYKVDVLKLDRSFLVDNRFQKRGETVIEGVVKIAHDLNMKVVAEGVETQEQIDFLKSINCEIGQGYYYERPICLEEFELNYLTQQKMPLCG